VTGLIGLIEARQAVYLPGLPWNYVRFHLFSIDLLNLRSSLGMVIQGLADLALSNHPSRLSMLGPLPPNPKKEIQCSPQLFFLPARSM